MPGRIGSIGSKGLVGRDRFSFLVIALALLWAFPAVCGPLVFFEPQLAIVDPNDLFDLVIGIDDGTDTISTFHVIFDYDPAVIEFQQALEGSLYASSGYQTWFGYLESSPGTAEVYDVIFPALSFVLPPGELAVVRFRALADGVSPIHFIAVPLIADINRDSLLDVSSQDATVIVGEPSTGIESEPGNDRNWIVGAPFPNPARGESRIVFRRPASDPFGTLEFGVFDISGRLVRNLNTVSVAAASELFWDGRDDRGAEVPPGVYFFRLETAGESVSRKLILVR